MNKWKCCITTVVPLLLAMACLMAGACLADATSDLQQGIQLYQAGSYDAAIPVLNVVACADPSLAAEAQLRLTQCYHEQGKIAEAVAAAKAGITAAILPKDIETLKLLREGLAFLCGVAQDYQGAQEQYDALAKENPDESAQWLQKLAGCYLQQSKNAEAVDTIRKGIASAVLPRDRDFLKPMRSDLAYLCSQLQDWPSAQEQYEALAKEYPDESAHWLRELSVCYMQQGKNTEAIQTLSTGISQAVLPRDREVLALSRSDIASLYVSNSDWPSAQEQYEELAKENPDESAHWLRELSVCYIREGKNTEAMDAMKRGIAAAVLPRVS